MKSFILRCLLFISLFGGQVAHAQVSRIDTTFQPIDYIHDYIPKVVAYPNSGDFLTRITSFSQTLITKFDSEGQELNGFRHSLRYNPQQIITQSDGKALLYGDFPGYRSSWPNKNLLRLHADLSVDSSFHPPVFKGDSGWSTLVNNMQILQRPNGCYLLFGKFNSVGNDSTNRTLIQLLPNGTFDSSFALDSTYLRGNNRLFNIKSLYDGSLLLSIERVNPNGNKFFTVRTFPNGSVDTTFHPDMHLSSDPCVGSNFYELRSGKLLNMYLDTLFRFHANGKLDTNFHVYHASDYLYNVSSGTKIVLEQPDGRLIIVHTRRTGSIPSIPNHNLVRLHANGLYDSSFAEYFMLSENGYQSAGGSGGIRDGAPIEGFMQPNGKLVVWPNLVSRYQRHLRRIRRIYNTDSTIALRAPQPDFTVLTQNVYTGDNVSVTNRTPVPAQPGAVQYRWSIRPNTGWGFEASSSVTSTNPVIRFLTAGRYSITLQATYNGMVDDTTKTNYITVAPIPAPKPAFSADTTPFFPRQDIRTFYNETPPPVRPRSVSYRWSIRPDTGWAFTPGTNSASREPSVSFNVAGSYSITLRTYVGNETADTTKINYIRVKPVIPPQPDFLVQQNTLYAGDSVLFYNQTPYPQQITAQRAFRWTISPNRGIVYARWDSSTSHQPAIRFDSAGTYSVTLRCTVGTLSADTTRVDYITVNHVPAPRPDFESFRRIFQVGEYTAFYNYTARPVVPRAVNFTWAMQPDTGWAYAPGSTSNSEMLAVQFLSPGYYGVGLRATIWPLSADTLKPNYILVEEATAVKQRTSGTLQVKPNPARDVVHIHSKARIHKISLTDALGRIVFSDIPEAKATSIHVATLPKGVYQVLAEIEGGILRTRLVKE